MYIQVPHKVACLGSQSCFAKILYINNIMWCMVEEYLFTVSILDKLIYKIVAIFYTCINNNEIPGDLSCKDMMFICKNNTLSSHVKDHHCYGYKINRAFHNKKLLKWNGLVFHWCFIISRTLHGFLEIQDFCSRVEEILHSFAVLTREIFFNTRREISYFREAMYYPLCLYIFFLY